jgi:hypothetical protein
MNIIERRAAQTTYVVVIRLEGGGYAWIMERCYLTADGKFFFYYGVMKSNKRLSVGRYECRRIINCELHEIFRASVFKVEDLNEETLLRSSRKPFTPFELNHSSLFATLH